MRIKAEEVGIVNQLIPLMLRAIVAAARLGEHNPLEPMARLLERHRCQIGEQDDRLGHLLARVETLASYYNDRRLQIRGLDGSSNLGGSLASWHRLPSARRGRWPVPRLLDALRGASTLDCVAQAIDRYADHYGYPDWRVPVPHSLEDFYFERFTASMEGHGERVHIRATGTPVSRLVWRVYGGSTGCQYLGVVTTAMRSDGRITDSEEKYLPLLFESTIGQIAAGRNLRVVTGAGRLRITEVRDETPDCSEEDFALLRMMVREHVHPGHTGVVAEYRAWSRAVSMRERMDGLPIRRSDLRRALLAEGWQPGPTQSYWQRAE